MEQKLKILIATGVYPPEIGGPATYVFNLARELVKDGQEVKILSYGHKTSEPEAGLSVQKVGRNGGALARYLAYFIALRKLAPWSNLIYAHDLISVGLPAALVKILNPRLKLVVRLGGDFLWEKAYNNRWTERPLTSYYEIPKNFKEKVYLAIYRFVLKRVDLLIFSTTWQKSIYEKYFPQTKFKSVIIKNTFPDVLGVASQPAVANKNMLFAGRLIRLKNLERLIAAMQEINGLNLQIIGEGPAKSKLEAKVQELGLSSKVFFKETISAQELKNEILKSYLVICPSISDVAPNIALEAIKLGRPLLLTKETGLYEDFKEQLIFLDPFSQEDITNKIKNLLLPNNYQSYLQKIRNIKTDRSWRELTREHLALFKKLSA